MLDLDLLSLRNPERFQQMCFRLARYEYPSAQPMAYGSHDQGRDVTAMLEYEGEPHVVVFQSKFVEKLPSAKRKITESLDALRDEPYPISLWVLCVPVDPSTKFMAWLEVETHRRGRRLSVWGRSELLRRLEQHPDVIDVFFRGVHAELSRFFRSASLELFTFKLDPTCEEWTQPDTEALRYVSRNVYSPDLVLDLVVRNTGAVATAITSVSAEVFDWHMKPHGFPGEGLLFPKIEYAISIADGAPGRHSTACDPPLLVGSGSLERFKLRITDTGYAWNGAVRITLHAGPDEELVLPAIRLWT